MNLTDATTSAAPSEPHRLRLTDHELETLHGLLLATLADNIRAGRTPLTNVLRKLGGALAIAEERKRNVTLRMLREGQCYEYQGRPVKFIHGRHFFHTFRRQDEDAPDLELTSYMVVTHVKQLRVETCHRRLSPAHT